MIGCPNCFGPVPFYYWHADGDAWCCAKEEATS